MRYVACQASAGLADFERRCKGWWEAEGVEIVRGKVRADDLTDSAALRKHRFVVRRNCAGEDALDVGPCCSAMSSTETPAASCNRKVRIAGATSARMIAMAAAEAPFTSSGISARTMVTPASRSRWIAALVTRSTSGSRSVRKYSATPIRTYLKSMLFFRREVSALHGGYRRSRSEIEKARALRSENGPGGARPSDDETGGHGALRQEVAARDVFMQPRVENGSASSPMAFCGACSNKCVQ